MRLNYGGDKTYVHYAALQRQVLGFFCFVLCLLVSPAVFLHNTDPKRWNNVIFFCISNNRVQQSILFGYILGLTATSHLKTQVTEHL